MEAAVTIDLDQLQQLAAQATPGPWHSDELVAGLTAGYPHGVFNRNGRLALATEDDAAYLAACDPATITALIRAVKAAVGYHAWQTGNVTVGNVATSKHELDAALAPFRNQTT